MKATELVFARLSFGTIHCTRQFYSFESVDEILQPCKSESY